MSTTPERSALDRPVSWYAYALQLLDGTPAGPSPDDGVRRDAPLRERLDALTALLRDFLDDPAQSPQELHDRCAALAIRSTDVSEALSQLRHSADERTRQTGRWLIRNGTDKGAVLVGLGLLIRNGERADAEIIKTIGLLRFADLLAVEALARIRGAEPQLIWLAERSRRRVRTTAVIALAGRRAKEIRRWIRSTPRDLLTSGLARKIAEQQDLPGLLAASEVDDEPWDQVANLLLAMASTDNYVSEIRRYAYAEAVYERWVALAPTRQPSLERAVLLTLVAEDLRTGSAAPVVGEARGELVARIEAVLAAPEWRDMLDEDAAEADPVVARRASWVIRQGGPKPLPAKGFAIRVVVADPSPTGSGQVEARIVVDGMPVVARYFDKGPAASPEALLTTGRLRATEEPHEVRLAEAYCTEGCCGGLYVTIVREGTEVVWRNWRSSSTADDLPAEVRFDAVAYDQEVSRAGHDHSWEWPARSVARLVTERLRAEPEILGRWDCRPGWCAAWLREYDTVRLTFQHPAARSSAPTDPSVQFGLVIDVDDRDPTEVAETVVASLIAGDPKEIAEMVGGTTDGPALLGLEYRPPSRW
ncbi:hypothetical protein AB0M47_11205 [Hamadaea sp. NPDC051192]|uniref:hypothetical protein n=1 Tax=Hamadaea sp. NPDC051192 TaxID=3154940 RepID=UPI00343DEEFB